MSKYLQQFDASPQSTNHEVGDTDRRTPLLANYALLLVLVIIPTLSGAVLIA